MKLVFNLDSIRYIYSILLVWALFIFLSWSRSRSVVSGGSSRLSSSSSRTRSIIYRVKASLEILIRIIRSSRNVLWFLLVTLSDYVLCHLHWILVRLRKSVITSPHILVFWVNFLLQCLVLLPLSGQVFQGLPILIKSIIFLDLHIITLLRLVPRKLVIIWIQILVDIVITACSWIICSRSVLFCCRHPIFKLLMSISNDWLESFIISQVLWSFLGYSSSWFASVLSIIFVRIFIVIMIFISFLVPFEFLDTCEWRFGSCSFNSHVCIVIFDQLNFFSWKWPSSSWVINIWTFPSKGGMLSMLIYIFTILFPFYPFLSAHLSTFTYLTCSLHSTHALSSLHPTVVAIFKIAVFIALVRSDYFLVIGLNWFLLGNERFGDWCLWGGFAKLIANKTC